MTVISKMLLAFALLLPALASAQSAQNRVRYSINGSTKLLASAALNASPGTRTVTLDVGGRNRITWQVDLVRNAATTLTMTCKASLNNGATYADITDQVIANGVGTLTPHTWSRDVSGVTAGTTVGTIFELDTATYDNVQCAYGGASAGGTDTINVWAIGGAGL